MNTQTVEKNAVEPEVENNVNTSFGIEDIDSLINLAEKETEAASQTAQQIQALILKRQKALEDIANSSNEAEAIKENAKKFNAKRPQDLLKEGRMSKEDADRLEKMRAIVQKAKAVGIKDQSTKKIVDLYDGIMNNIHKENEEIKKTAIEEAEKDFQNKLTANEEIIFDIEKNPRVIEELSKMAKKEYTQDKREREEDADQFIKSVEKSLNSINDRNKIALQRISLLIGKDNIPQEVNKGEEEEQKKTVIAIKNDLRSAIISGEQDLKPQDLIPWTTNNNNPNYLDVLNSIREETFLAKVKKITELSADGLSEQQKEKVLQKIEKANKILEKTQAIIEDNDALRRIFGSKFYTDKKTGAKKISSLWEAFDIRAKNNETGETKRILESRKAEQAKIQEILDRGGFEVNIPVYNIGYKGKKNLVGYGKGYVLVEKVTSAKGNEIYKVTEMTGYTNGLKEGDSSPINMSAFSDWFKEQLKDHMSKNSN